MSDPRPAFVVPEGLVLSSESGGFSVEYDGDIILNASLGQPLVRVRSRSGDVVLGTDVEVQEVSAPRGSVRGDGRLKARAIVARELVVDGDLEADGVFAQSVRITGNLTAERVTAESGPIRVGGHAVVSDEMVATAGNITVDGGVSTTGIRTPTGRVTVRGVCKAEYIRAGSDVVVHGDATGKTIESDGGIELHGSSKLLRVTGDSVRITGSMNELATVSAQSVISVGPGRIESDLFLSPVVDISSETEGRVTVVECHNPLGPTAVKGLLRLQDLSTLIGNPTQFLADRGLSPLGTPQTGDAPPSPPVPPLVDDADHGPAHDAPPPESTEDEQLQSAVIAALEEAERGSAPQDILPDDQPSGGAPPVDENTTDPATMPATTSADDTEAASDPDPDAGDAGDGDIDAASAQGDESAAPEAASDAYTALTAAPSELDVEDDATAEMASDGSDAGRTGFYDLPQEDDTVADPVVAPLEPSDVTGLDTQPAADAPAAEEPESTEYLADTLVDFDAYEQEPAQEQEQEQEPAHEPDPEPEPEATHETFADTVVDLDANDVEAELEADSSNASEAVRLDPSDPDDDASDEEEVAVAEATSDSESMDTPPEDGMGDDSVTGWVAAPDDVMEASVDADDADDQIEGESESSTVAAETDLDDADMAAPAADAPQDSDVGDEGEPVSTLEPDVPSEEALFQFTESDVSGEEGPLAMGSDEEEYADDVLDLSTPGSTVVLPRDMSQPVEEVEVRPPSGPDPDSRDKLMLVEDSDSADEAPAPAPQAEDAAAAQPAPAPPPARRPPVFNDPVYALMVETMDRIRGVYGTGTVPEPVHRIQALVDSQDYARIRTEFSVLMDELTSHHRQAGTHLQPRVAHNLRIIDTLVRNL